MQPYRVDTRSDELTLILAAQTVVSSREVRDLEVATGSLRNPEADYSSVNPRIGLIYELREELGLFANVSRLFEPPTNFELQDNVAGGDATLDAMQGTVVEIGARGGSKLGATSRWSWDVSLYLHCLRLRNTSFGARSCTATRAGFTRARLSKSWENAMRIS